MKFQIKLSLYKEPVETKPHGLAKQGNTAL